MLNITYAIVFNLCYMSKNKIKIFLNQSRKIKYFIPEVHKLRLAMQKYQELTVTFS